MKTQEIIIVEYQSTWPDDFNKIKAELETDLKDLILSIEHVGSTSVIGLAAKPIIDIDVVIESKESLPTIIQRLALMGYYHRGNLGIQDREAFSYEGKEHLRLHHLYVCPKESKELHRHITFRNHLRNHPEDVKCYADIKKEAAKLYPNDRDAYGAHKSKVIEELYLKCGLELSSS